ncbi:MULTISPECIES: oxaloacetate decarboxylase subunit gamma [Vibrio]|uniref:Probable oxaloacetate decarboxylase gamma chain n=1 Tax=Vibrio halioticoli NBRC 102217 TaxID=1219072 RepID=V5FP93_9VIBR|nr:MULTISPECIES: oxaloacetate decarboxylase subunit gamma [Vibrio]MPW34962.1 oxaloacetate decarboxylase subunit gamma [Vibrio sp. B1Z05]GAD91371.1 putative oxaloacetate decarboxylase gamma chain [Vibrio halioticoli NBRC 102217]
MDNITGLLSEAASIMAIGMAMVFLFLTLLVFVVRLMSKLLPTEQPTAPVRPKNTKQVKTADSTAQNDPKIVAAISAAVHRHRSTVAQ